MQSNSKYIFKKIVKPQTFENDYIYIYTHTHTHTQWFRGTASPLSLKSTQPLNTDNNIPSVFTVTVQAGQIIWYPIITDCYNVPHIMSSHIGICLAGVHTHTHTHRLLCALGLVPPERVFRYSTNICSFNLKNPTMVLMQATLHPPEDCGKCGHQEPARGVFL